MPRLNESRVVAKPGFAGAQGIRASCDAWCKSLRQMVDHQAIPAQFCETNFNCLEN
jgi:hypothetical protein